MRFALLGDHPDGVAMARALAATGRHTLAVYAGPAAGLTVLERDGLQPERIADLEEALAHPALEGVIVAGTPAQRETQLRRAIQSEFHVLCVHPVDPSADVAYEAASLQSDVRRVLMPLLPESLHPGVRRLAELARGGLVQPVRMMEWERWSTDEWLLDSDQKGHKPTLPGWDVLRLIGGEIGEVFGMTQGDELTASQPILLSGAFVQGGLWQATLLPQQNRPFCGLALVGNQSRAELTFPQGWPGPSQLSFVDDDGQARREEWPEHHPWAAVVEAFESAVAEWKANVALIQPGVTDSESLTTGPHRLTWLDAIRALEVDDALRRSIHRGRASSLDFPEATEEASFKGAMTLVGCSLLWISLLLLILSIWLPWLGWFILPVFGVFLLLQLLRGFVPKNEG